MVALEITTMINREAMKTGSTRNAARETGRNVPLPGVARDYPLTRAGQSRPRPGKIAGPVLPGQTVPGPGQIVQGPRQIVQGPRQIAQVPGQIVPLDISRRVTRGNIHVTGNYTHSKS